MHRREFLQGTSLLALGAAARVVPAGGGAQGARWTVGNALVERELRFEPGRGLYTAGWRHRRTGTDFVRDFRTTPKAAGERGAEFSLRADDVTLRGAGDAFALLGAEARPLPPAGRALDVRLRAARVPLDVTVTYAVYDGHAAVRKWLTVANRGARPVVLSRLAFEAVGLLAGPESDLELAGYYGAVPRELFYTGRVEDPAVLQRNARTGEGLVVMNEAPGHLKRTEVGEWWRAGTRVMYDTDLFPFERTLAPGEAFRTAASSVLCFVDDGSSAGARWAVPSYATEVLLKKGAGYRPPWIYNTWEPFERRIDAATTRELVDAAADMGLDVFAIDDGWSVGYGTNAVDTVRFPGGLDPVRAQVEARGMRLGLWAPLATDPDAYAAHPEWVTRDARGRPKVTATAAGDVPVMCLASPYREAAARRINELIARHHLAYVKLDLTTIFNAYGESPGCNAPGHDHPTWAESLTRTYEGIRRVTDAVYARHPDVLLDLTFELWGQKHVIDYGLLAAGDLDWLSNVSDDAPSAAGPRQARTLLYHRALAIPADAMLIGNLRADTAPAAERFATAIGAGPLLVGDLRALTPGDRARYAGWIRWYKALRQAVPLHEGFFPLGAWRQPSAAHWDGYARLSRAGEGFVALFRNAAREAAAEFPLPLDAAASYTLRPVLAPGPTRTVRGADVRGALRVAWPNGSPVEVLEVRRARG